MSKLEKSLASWVSKNLINQQQANNIQQYEMTRNEFSWILFGFLILGAIIIGIGTISLIAANWQYIPDTIKIFANFTILSIIAMFIVHAFSQDKKIHFEILLLIFMLFCLASIGLISQIYNTGGELYQALMLWSVITFPITIFTRDKLVHMIIPFIWLSGFLIGLINTMLYSPLLFQYFHFNVMAIAMAIPLFCACLILLARILYFSAGYINALISWFFISGFIAIGIAEFESIIHKFITHSNLVKPYYPGYILAILTAVGIFIKNDYNKEQKLILLLALVTFISSFHIYLIFPDPSSFLYAIFTIATFSFIAIFAASIRQRKLFNLLLFSIGIRFLVLYFQAIGGLATTGIGLIISGLIIIGMTYYWNKYRSDIANWIEGWMH